MERLCVFCGAAINGRVDKIFCSDNCRGEYHNLERRRRERELRSVNRVLSGNWRILSRRYRNGRKTASVGELAAEGFNYQIYTSTRHSFPGRRIYCCYNMAYRVSRSGKVHIFTNFTK